MRFLFFLIGLVIRMLSPACPANCWWWRCCACWKPKKPKWASKAWPSLQTYKHT